MIDEFGEGFEELEESEDIQNLVQELIFNVGLVSASVVEELFFDVPKSLRSPLEFFAISCAKLAIENESNSSLLIWMASYFSPC